jgi:hypothetical protein
MLPDNLRNGDSTYILQRVSDGDCCALVGVSNTGKSSLLRALARREVRRQLRGEQAGAQTFVYIDFNLMLEATEQGFYELILRCLMEELALADPVARYLERLQAAYKTLVAPPTAFQISLSFSEGLTAVCQGLSENLVLLFDEFDEPFEQIDGRAFLNLRALKDKYRQRLSYVAATNRRLSNIRRGRDVDEYIELFGPFTRFLAPLEPADVEQIIAWVAAQERYTFDDEDRQFIGHHADVRDRLDRDLNVQAECRKLWADLTEAQQDALMGLVGAEDDIDRRAVDSLRMKGIIHTKEDLLFSPVMEGFVRRQRLTRRRRHEGVRLDVESGNVWVDGRQTPTLTELEYRLLLLLYGRLNKICDKYTIVEAVWGEEYIDQVDDARIDKLLSRLRAKIEPDPPNPRYLVTVRGRGYKLLNP